MYRHDEYPHTSRIVVRIFNERCRQQDKEGYLPEVDDTYSDRELVNAAIAYCQATGRRSFSTAWPWNRFMWKPSDNVIRNLEKAAALIVAEIERLERAKPVIDLDNPTTFTVGEVSWQEPQRHAPLGAADRDPQYMQGAVLGDPLAKPEMTSPKPWPPANLEEVVGKKFEGQVVGISITEEQFRRWALDRIPEGYGPDYKTENDRHKIINSWWRSFKEAAGWPRY